MAICNKSILQNIEISDEMKSDLMSDVKMGRRTKDKRFRYSTALMALCIVGVTVFSGAGASAAYITYKNRLENMSQEEQEDYTQELENDTYNTVGEALTREFTKEENDRLVELERKYYNDNVFPAETMPYLDTLSELEDGMLAYVVEDNKIHIPDELTDEQLLQYIDHQAKYMYTIEQNAEEMEEAEETAVEDDAQETKATDTDAADKKEELAAETKQMIKDYFGEEIDDTWILGYNDDVDPELEAIDNKWVGYSVFWSENESLNANFYQFVIPRYEGGVFIAARGGLELFNSCEEYSWDEVQEYLPQGEETVKAFVKEHFGLGEPDRIEYGGFEGGDGTSLESDTVFFELYYGEKLVTVDWLISLDQVNGVVGEGLYD